MQNIKSIDMLLVDDLFEMESGYVLDFSNPSFPRIFAEELNVDIDSRAYSDMGARRRSACAATSTR